MKKSILFFALNIGISITYGQNIARPIDLAYRDKIVAAIYRAEGGAKTRYPYGIKSIVTTNEAHAKRICENTVANNYIRWQKAGKTNEFINFLGNRYCPIGAKDDPTGLNRNWIKNVKAQIK